MMQMNIVRECATTSIVNAVVPLNAEHSRIRFVWNF